MTEALKSFRLAGSSWGAWGFALRTWASMVLALGVAFWLQLAGASSAAICVAILSLQTRGQTFQKAAYRVLGTIVGVIASVAIAAAFNQTRELFFLACCGWLGLCTGVASLLAGNQAYAAILSGYTVAIVALSNVDMPLNTFSIGIDRGAAIIVGISVVAVVNTLFLVPELFPDVLRKLEAAREKVTSFAVRALREGRADALEAAALLKEITALNPDITALPSESAVGRARVHAAQAVLVNLLRTVSAARVVSGVLASLGKAGEEQRDKLVRALETREYEDIRRRALNVMEDAGSTPYRVVGAAACLALFEQEEKNRDTIQAMREGRAVAGTSRVALYRSRNAALRNGLRAALALGLSAWLLALLGWSATTTTLVQIGAMTTLAATTPDTRGFALTALVGVPLAAVASGVTEFLILDGVDQFELLALGMAPAVIAACLMIMSGKPFFSGVGFLLLVFVPTLMAPSNPQSYNPQNYLFGSFFSLLAVILLFVVVSVLLPVTPRMRGSWMLASARLELRKALFGLGRRFDAPAGAFRDADRLGQFGSLALPGNRDQNLRYLFRLSDLAACARRLKAAVEANGATRRFAPAVRNDLAALDSKRLQQLGRTVLVESAGHAEESRRALRQLGTDLLFASILIERSPRMAARLREQRAP